MTKMPDVDFCGRNVLVIGLAKSGIAAGMVLLSKGARVSVYDASPEVSSSEKVINILEAGAKLVTGAQNGLDVLGFDLIVISPGVPSDIAPLLRADSMDIPVVSELELAYMLAEDTIILAVTGTNGKTTTVSLLDHILTSSGIKHVTAGNIGLPMVSLVDGCRSSIVVLEVSSFQLERMIRFKPHAAAILNITSDHIDRHLDIDRYADMKYRIFQNQDRCDYAVLNYDDEVISNRKPPENTNVIYYSARAEEGVQLFMKNGKIVSNFLYPCSFSLQQFHLVGEFNISNAMAAIALSQVVGTDAQAIQHSLDSFRPIVHRLEYVATVNGVRFYNDSKATNPDSSLKALKSFDGNISLILGGKDKGMDFSLLCREVGDHVRFVALIGESADKIGNVLAKFWPDLRIEYYDSLEMATRAAYLECEGDGIVLFSPACASFDMFDNYEHRGVQFKKIVSQIDEDEK
ncbi:MAG: UDP-N-acetylmuramoyl-L-alanine--D-glutamate ligase [Actinobacteria bacterium]|nr:UDP-N-acetylmuramoyl-L-alanine--D-glutamate ligase [Actinomycetota bacterium]